MRRLARVALLVFVSALVTLAAYLGGYGTAFLLHPAPQVAAEDHFRVFWESWRIVQDQYYGAPLDSSVLTYGAIRGALTTLGDPFTWFAEPEEAQRIKEAASGKYTGIGAVVNEDDAGNVLIVRPFQGGPADRAGLLPGDIVLEVEGTETRSLELEQAVGEIRGPAGTPVRLLVQRAGLAEPFEVELLRAEIEIPSVEYEMLDGGIAYLKLNEFRANAPQQVHITLEELLRQGPNSLILDLRDNPGGLLSSSIEIASEFVAEGVIALEKGSNGLDEQHLARGDGLATEIPLVVLVNDGTASASEIVAGAIRDHERGVLIGETTLGKGSVQSPVDLSDGSHLRLTIAHWFTPNGQLIQGHGLAPDIEVPLTEEDLANERDPQLDRAIAYLLER
ncbi:MAG TPA: S41 family peptidase [Anaerolineae bacterium]|nr:S41 family peptidase [Anaerolineae bacterium]